MACRYLPLILTVLFTSSCISERAMRDIQLISIGSGLEKPICLELSQFATDVDYIALSSDNGALIKRINILENQDSILLLSDLSNCYVYSTRGEMLRRIGAQGRGPAEYLYISNAKLGLDGSIYIQSSRDLLKYSREGIFQERYNLFKTDVFSGRSPGNWSFINDSTLFIQIRNDSGSEENMALLADLSGYSLKPFKNFCHFTNVRQGSSTLSAVSSIYEFNGVFSYKELFNDTLYRLNNASELVPKFIFSLGSLEATYLDYYEQTMGRTSINRDWARINDIFETDDVIIIDLQTSLEYLKRPEPFFEEGVSLIYYATQILMVYDKLKRETYFVDITRTDEKLLRTGLFNDMDGGPKFYPRFRMGENRFAMPVQAYDLKRYVGSESFKNATAKLPEKKRALEELANRLSDDDNPVLMVVKMK